MNILAMGASSSTQSINKKLAAFAGKSIKSATVKVLDLNDYEMPIYSIDRESYGGIPKKAQAFKELLEESDGVIISFAEHNGSYSVAFKNIMDWMSRIEGPTWSDKPFSLPLFQKNFDDHRGVLDAAANDLFEKAIKEFETSILD